MLCVYKNDCGNDICENSKQKFSGLTANFISIFASDYLIHVLIQVHSYNNKLNWSPLTFSQKQKLSLTYLQTPIFLPTFSGKKFSPDLSGQDLAIHY